MAELALSLASAILDPVIEKLSSEIWKQLGLLWSLKGDLNKLKMTLEDIKGVLNSAEQRATTDESVRKWLWDLKDVAYDADDVLDDVQVELLRRSSNNSVLTAKVHDFFSSNNQVLFRYEIANKIKEINAKLNEIDVRKNRFQFPVTVVSHNTEVISTERETFSAIADEEGLYGRDDDKKRIMTFLLEKDNDKPLSVLPIVGLGGLGKTTLAKMVYNDKRTKEQFEPLIWVCVSENFKVKQVITKIIHTIGKQINHPEHENMQKQLHELISGKKFFLVLDDIWHDGDLQQIDDSGWEALISSISCGRLGSKVIVTTRDRNVATITGTLDSHQLKDLEFGDCWKLFCNRAFKKESQSTPWMEDIGKKIVRKCGGLPLAAKALGGLMRTKQRESEWVAIRDSEIWTLPEEEIKILPALRLSYLHLPAHLKQCFVYCSLFPKDYRFLVDKLIELWIIEGFIFSEAGTNPTEIGNSYYRALLLQSFFQDEEEEEEVIRCSMHDLVHDLACSIAGPEFAFQGRMLSGTEEKWRYLSIDLGDQLLERGKIIDAISKARKLRSFISFNPAHEAREIDMLSGLPYLRVLSLEEVVGWKGREVITTALHNVIPRLKHLRLLDLSKCGIEALPDAITSLHSLQVLDLPPFIHRLIKLPRDMSKLTKLEKLQYFVVLKEPGRTITELQQLNMLRGDLFIFGLELVKDAQEAKMANLIAKKSLRALGLTWKLVSDISSNSESDINEERGNSCNIFDCMNSLVRSSTTPSLPGPIDEDTLKKHVLDSLQPPEHLERLDMAFYDGTMFPSWMTSIEQLSMYQNLTILNLRNLEKCKHLPPLGHLPRLKKLKISKMPCLEQIGSEFYGDEKRGIAFPSLETLKLDEMPNLELWLIGDNSTAAAFPRLERLYMNNLEKCKHLPPLGQLPRLKRLLIMDMPCLEQIGREFYGDERGGIAFPSLEALKLGTMPNLELWLIGDHPTTAAFPRLEDLHMSNLGKCKHLPLLGQLPHLKKLEIWGMPCLEQIGSEFYGDGRGGIAFPSLEFLLLYNMPNLELWHPTAAAFPRLEDLKMSKLGKCKHLPRLGQLPHLKNLRIRVMPCLEKIGSEFYGDGREGIAFPSLKTLDLNKMPNLELWLIEDHPTAAAFPCLEDLKMSELGKCKLLPPLGQLPRLKKLEMSVMPCLEQIGTEFYGDGRGGIAFPSLEILTLDEMRNLEIWLIEDHPTAAAFPCLEDLKMSELGKCKLLPPLGQLPRLKKLEMSVMPCLEQIGTKFYGDGRGGIAFPSLEILTLDEMRNLEIWLIEDHPTAAAFPCLEDLKMSELGKCKLLPPLGQLPRLKKLEMSVMPCLEQIGTEFYGDGRGGIAFPSLEILTLDEMRNLEIWVIEDHPTAAAFPCLEDLKMSELGKCKLLPPLGQLPRLKKLEMSVMPCLEQIGTEFYGDGRGGIAFPSLEILTLGEMQNLELLHLGDHQTAAAAFPRLKDLELSKCPKLMTVQPCLQSSITSMELWHINEQVLSRASLGDPFSKLKKLRIRSCVPSSGSGIGGWDGLQHLTALEELSIESQDELVSLPVGIIQHRFPSLRRLRLYFLPNLRSLCNDDINNIAGRDHQEGFQDCFPSLRRLVLYSLCQLRSPFSCSPLLQHLEIAYCPKLTALPEWLERLPSLQSINIEGCANLTKVPQGLRHLVSRV